VRSKVCVTKEGTVEESKERESILSHIIFNQTILQKCIQFLIEIATENPASNGNSDWHGHVGKVLVEDSKPWCPTDFPMEMA